MEYRKLGQSDLQVSVVGIGCWAMGGIVKLWGPVDDNESIAAIRKGLDLGINFIDTAPSYGYGHSEEVVGRAISGLRERVIISTQCGLVWREPGGRFERNLTRESIRKECEASLRRLRVETIDLYQLHRPDPAAPLEDTMEALAALRQSGKILHVGLSNFDAENISKVRQRGTVVSLQTELSLLERNALDDLLPYCREYQLAVIAYGPLARGLLTGKFDPASTFTGLRSTDQRFTGEAYRRNLMLTDKLASISARLGCTTGQLALRWVIQQDGVTCAIAGAKRFSQVQENTAAGELKLSREVMDEIDVILREHDAK
jgi:aryl-alcohol dehydrogenase-like predicted oxidoreductase